MPTLGLRMDEQVFGFFFFFQLRGYIIGFQ